MLKILVTGDSMIDRYYFGDVTRLSQEAPVPVVKYLREEQRAGAAGNVAMNCRAMGGDTMYMSIVGDDDYGKAFAKMIPDSNLIIDRINGTTNKLRVIGKQQQITRVDFDHAPSNSLPEHLRDMFFIEADFADIIIFSDYGKGTLKNVAEMIAYAKRKGKVVLVDPKGHNYEKYRGADLIKPNLDEMKEMVGGWDSEDELSEKAQKFIAAGGFHAVLLTRAAKGMTLFTKDDFPFHVDAEARNVFDVTGAGDTSIAAFAVALAKGCTFKVATVYANKAAGVVVEKFGTAVATSAEVFGD